MGSLVQAAAIVLDCSNPEELSEFYREFLDGSVSDDASVNRIDIETATGFRIAFRRDLNATPGSWPRPDDSMQIHIDFLAPMEDMDELERRLIGQGALPVDASAKRSPNETRRYADPAGHVFTVRASLRQSPKTD
ncbi:VOC family protein [Streptomyces sp. NPDC048436]|uniref:VOC family protein n=1 Tax=Streptomyces sp. NPDC048436 TaxID=3365550 RepID=UPI00371F1A70